MNILKNTGVYLGSFLIARYAEQGLAHTLGVTTMRHGTNPLSWLSIHLIGLQPSMGNSLIGGDKGVAVTSKNINKVYLACDVDDYEKSTDPTIFYRAPNIFMRFIPRFYAFVSTANLFVTPLFLPTVGDCTHPNPLLDRTKPNKIQVIMTLFISTLLLPVSLLIPTIKVRIDPEKIYEYSSDGATNTPYTACSTDKPIYPLHIGIVGTLWNGLTYKVVSRTFKNPRRCITGIAMMSLSALAAYWAFTTMPNVLITHKTAAITGVILAIV